MKISLAVSFNIFFLDVAIRKIVSTHEALFLILLKNADALN